MRRTLVVFIALSVSVFCLGAADAYLSGETTLDMVVSIPPVDDAGAITKAMTSQILELDAYGDVTALYVNGGFRFNALDCTISAFLSEAYVDFYLDKFSFRFGRQKAAWGVAEISSAVDVITPSDMSDPVNKTKMGIDALKLSYDAFPFAFDVYWIPVFTPGVLPSSVSAMYSFYGIGLKKPEPCLENGEFAARASAYTSAGDFMLYGYYGWEDIPSMTGEYDRLAMLGASVAVPVGQITLKGELGWYPKRDVVLSGTAGFEWIKDDFTLISEVYGEWNKENEELSTQVGGTVRYDLLDGDLRLSLSGIVELRELDGAVVFGMKYGLSDELKLSAEAVYVFEGPDEAGTYGAYKNLNCARFSVSYSF